MGTEKKIRKYNVKISLSVTAKSCDVVWQQQKSVKLLAVAHLREVEGFSLLGTFRSKVVNQCSIRKSRYPQDKIKQVLSISNFFSFTGMLNSLRIFM